MALDRNVVDQQVRRAVVWHFHPATGSPFWLRKAREWGLDALVEVRGLDDLLRLPPVADELRQIPARELIPRGCLSPLPATEISPGTPRPDAGEKLPGTDYAFAVWESGGTTGSPRRVVDAHDRARALVRMEAVLDAHGFPAATTGDWLHLGPTGPHLVGRTVQRLAARRRALCHYVDLDPRWARQLAAQGRRAELQAYLDHVRDQALDILATQPVEILAATPPLLSAICLDHVGRRLLRDRVRGVIWFGTAASDETVRQWRELLPGAVFVGWYGNTLAGISVQRPPRPGDPGVVFLPPWPDAHYVLVDPAHPEREVGPGETGQVRIHVLARELFLPHHLERDQAVRVASPPGEPDGLARVQPLAAPGSAPVVEGVY
jgi:hypothetical protein